MQSLLLGMSDLSLADLEGIHIASHGPSHIC